MLLFNIRHQYASVVVIIQEKFKNKKKTIKREKKWVFTLKRPYQPFSIITSHKSEWVWSHMTSDERFNIPK